MIRGVLFVSLALGLGGCPMYDAPAPRLRSPEIVRSSTPKDDGPKPAPVPIYIEQCDVPRPAAVAQTQRRDADARVTEGDARLAVAMKAPPDSPERAEAIKASLEKYRDAMTKDHFHADATLMLARTYDMFHRKKCALLMLQRIGEMRKSKFKDADRVGRSVENNADQWFAAYADLARNAVTP